MAKYYVTTFCNFAHDLKTGRPVGHECYVLPPAALAAEQRGDDDEANRILSTMVRTMVRGRRAPLVADEGNVYGKPFKYNKAADAYVVTLQDATSTLPAIYDVTLAHGDRAVPHGYIVKYRNDKRYRVYMYSPGHSADRGHGQYVDDPPTLSEAIFSVRQAWASNTAHTRLAIE